MSKRPNIGEACPEGTKKCICETLSELYHSEELTLRARKVSRTGLAAELGVPKRRIEKAVHVQRSKQPGRCIVRYDQLLKEWGHGRLWTERLPAIRAHLEHHKASGTLPVNPRGKLNRSAILQGFAPSAKSILSVLRKNPDLKALLDEYDITKDDGRYSPYKYEALEKKWKKLLASDKLKLANSRKISPS